MLLRVLTDWSVLWARLCLWLSAVLLSYLTISSFAWHLGPDLVAFLKRRREGEVKVVVEKEEAAMEEDVSRGGEPHEGREPEGARCDTLPSEVKDMEGSWLHMDVTESEKLEWMTDVPVTSQDDVGGSLP